jgi:hypothetical protein
MGSPTISIKNALRYLLYYKLDYRTISNITFLIKSY